MMIQKREYEYDDKALDSDVPYFQTIPFGSGRNRMLQ